MGVTRVCVAMSELKSPTRAGSKSGTCSRLRSSAVAGSVTVRVTPQFQSAKTILDIQRANFQLSKFRSQVSSGIRINRPSDDPTNAALVRRNRVEVSRLETDLATIRDAGFVHQQQVTTLTELRDTLTRATEVAIELNDGSKEPPFADVSAQEAENILERIFELTNQRQADGRYLFSGTATNRAAFSFVGGSTATATAVTYQGSNEASEAVIGRTLTVETFISGESAFQQLERSSTEYFGLTGARAGVGADSGTGLKSLIVRDNGTTVFGAGGNLTSGTDTANDTVGAHQITVTATGISLDGGAEVPLTASTNLVLRGPNGQQVSLNTDTGAGGTTPAIGTFDVFRGELSTDEGATFTTIAGTNQAVTNSVTGAVSYVDTSDIVAEGRELADHSGAYDIFEAVIALRDIATGKFGVSGVERSNYLSRLVGEFNRLKDSLLEPLGVQSARAENLKKVTTQIEDVQLELTRETAELEEADLPEAILNLQTQENLLQASLAAAARINQLSLVDFIA